MKRRPVIMVVDDEPLHQDVLLARAKEQHERTTEFGRLTNLGHVRVMETNEADVIRVEIEDEVFTDPRDEFPSMNLMARLQLAIAAGRSCNNGIAQKLKRAAAMGDSYRGYNYSGMTFDKAWLDEYSTFDPFDKRNAAMEQAYANVSKITAAVRRPIKGGKDWTS